MNFRRTLIMQITYFSFSFLLSIGHAQECYYAANKRAGSAIVPCSDPSKGVASCCQTGDICLSDDACWNAKNNVTYQYGCTDQTYASDACPKKCNLNVDKSNWIGLVYCRDVSNMWACHHPDTCGNCGSSTTWGPAIQSLPPLPRGCPDLAVVSPAFAGPTTLAPILSLPTAGATQMVYFSPVSGSYILVTGYTPSSVTARPSTTSQSIYTTRLTRTTGSTRIETSYTTTSVFSPGPNPNASPTPAIKPSPTEGPVEPLSTGAKAGIGVGASVGGLAVIVAIVLWLRRRQQSKPRVPSITIDQKEIPPEMWGKAELPASDSGSSDGKRMSSVQTMVIPTSPAPTYSSFKDGGLHQRESITMEADGNQIHELSGN